METTRRDFITGTAIGVAALTALGSGCQWRSRNRRSELITTVLGPILAGDMGITLPHEHVLVDFIGAAQASRSRYDEEEAFQKALPHLQRVRELGGRTFVECTPAYVGRDPALLARLARAAQLQILTNTGYYGAGKNKYLPPHAFTESAAQLSERWIREAKDGIEDTSIRPGFIKIGVDTGPLPEVHRKLVQAAARTHWATGLTIAGHTGNGAAALEELDILEREGVRGDAFIWVHAQSESDASLHARAAERGAWVEFDGVGPKSVDRHIQLAQAMKERGLLQRVLVSHDAGWYHVGEPGGGNFRSFETLFTEFIPALKQAGFSETEIHQLIVANPRQAFAVRVRGR